MPFPHLVLCRHGQTDWNAEGRFQGQDDVPMNALGRAQAERNGQTLLQALGERARGYRFLASPMRRTRDTMAILRAALGLDPDVFETDERLVEVHFGDWQGRTLAELDPRAVDARGAVKWRHRPPGEEAESYAMLARRLAPVFEEVRDAARPTVLVAHGGTVRAFFHLHLGLAEAEAAHLPVPQDRMLEVENGTGAWI